MKSTVAALVFAPLAYAASVIQVQVGNQGLNYDPDTVTAAAGDVVEFHFGAGHDVVSGSFDSPCQPSNGAIYSGEPNNGDIFSVTINSTDPVWIYCSVPHHCQSGMAMVINPPSSGDTLAAYKSAAQGVGSSNRPSGVSGGVFGAVAAGSSSSSASAAATSSGAAQSSASAAASSGSSSMAATSSGAGATAGSTTSAAATSSSTHNGVSNLMVDLSLIAGAVVGGVAMVL